MKKTNHKKRAVPGYTVGIDEVGRGPLAGPVCVGAVALSKENKKELRKAIKSGEVKFGDSKQLTEAQRRYWAAWRRKENIPYAVVCVPPSVIDKINISRAANRAAGHAFQKVKRRLPRSARNDVRVIADAGIKIASLARNDSFKSFPKADELVPAVSLASIIAKLHRDAYMKRLHKKHAAYDFITNKGYGTRAHRAALVKHGPSKAHRLTFLGKYATLKPLEINVKLKSQSDA